MDTSSVAEYDLRINNERLKSDLEALSRIGRSPEGTLTRQAFASSYEDARQWLHERMQEAGIESYNDGAGNVIGRIGPPGPCVMSGSHIDTVPDGGPLDGAYGVLAALECARVIKENDLSFEKAFEVVAFIDEEGHFLDMLGSKAIAGLINLKEIDQATSTDDEPLAQAMRTAGFDPEAVLSARRAKGDIAAFLELHIEQGPVLDAKGIPIGVVESIVGCHISNFYFDGESDHAGTTPMDLRKDAFMAAAEFAYKAREMVVREGGPHTRLTYGIVNLEPQVTNIVPKFVRLRQEVRDMTKESLAHVAAKTHQLADEVAAKHSVSLRHQFVAAETAIQTAAAVQHTIEDIAAKLGLPSYRMPSGAGHDAQIIALVAPTGVIFVPSKGGRSHRRDEWTDWHNLECGANVLLHCILRLLRNPFPELHSDG